MSCTRKGVTAGDIIDTYPDIVRAMYDSFRILPKSSKYQTRRRNFQGKYIGRCLTWEKIFETLTEAGYLYEITVVPKD
jgi:hypothetical protein